MNSDFIEKFREINGGKRTPSIEPARAITYVGEYDDIFWYCPSGARAKRMMIYEKL